MIRMSRPRKISTLYKAHKQGNPVRLLTAGSNEVIENLSRFIENICVPLTENMRYRIRDISHLLHIIDAINEKGIPDQIILVSLDIVNMLPNIDNVKRMEAARLALSARDSK